MIDAERLAEHFHERYEINARTYGYETREESRVPWKDVPEPNKTVMIETCRDLIQERIVEIGPEFFRRKL